MKKDLWAAARDVVILSPSQRVDRPRCGRRRIQPEGRPHTVGYLLKPNGARMTCRNFGCDRYLRRNPEGITCCSACRDQLREFCEAILAVMDGKMSPKDFPVKFRGNVRRLQGLVKHGKSLWKQFPDKTGKKGPEGDVTLQDLKRRDPGLLEVQR